jgi:hypothetical protein
MTFCQQLIKINVKLVRDEIVLVIGYCLNHADIKKSYIKMNFENNSYSQ